MFFNTLCGSRKVKKNHTPPSPHKGFFGLNPSTQCFLEASVTVGNLCVVVMEALATERILFCKCFKALKIKRNIVGK